MNKILVCFLLCSSFLISSLSADEPNKTLHEKCLYPTVKLVIPSYHGGGCGTGIIVRSFKQSDGTYSNVVLTAAHILKGPVDVYVPQFENWSTVTGFVEYKCILFAYSKKYDLAVIVFDTPKEMPVAELDFDSKYYIGTKIFKLGYGLTDECRLDEGEITSVKTSDPKGFENHLRLNAHTIFGDSGGPVFLSSNYKVIGINKAIRHLSKDSSSQLLLNFAYASPLSWLKTWNTESDNAFSFAFDKNIPVPPMKDVMKRNYMLNLKANLDGINNSIVIQEADVANKKQVKIAIEAEIKRIEDGGQIPTQRLEPEPDLDEPAIAPAPPE